MLIRSLPVAGLLLLATASLTLGQQTVVFQKQAARPGETAQQSLQCDLQLTMSIRQGGQVVQEQKQGLVRAQQRHLTILQVDRDKPLQAEVQYIESTVTVQPDGLAAQKIEQSIGGKTYLVTRAGEKLTVTYPDGSAPPAEELDVVMGNMETFGLPNPIAEFFHGKKVRVGETLKLPTHLAQELLGFAETPGGVSGFQLKLVEVRAAEKKGLSPVAVFDIQLQAENPADESGVQMQLAGQLEMEVNSCRSRAVRLQGPVVSEETHGPKEGEFQVRSEGQIDVAVKADYSRRK